VAALPLVDLTPSRGTDPAARLAVARAIDTALHETGFLLISGHGIPASLLDDARAAALQLFHLPPERKAEVRMSDDVYRGWVPSGVETNAAAYGAEDAPADLKEGFVFGPPAPEDPEYRARGAHWFLPNRLPAAAPAVGATFPRLFAAMERLALHLLSLTELAMDVPAGTFVDKCSNGISTLDANWYPPSLGMPALPDQYRIGPHTDWGGMTLLDRQPGMGGLQIQNLDDEWVDAPYVPGTLTVNTGDLISHWSGGRWRSTRHRVLAPPPEAPTEELLSLVFFHDPDYDAVITPLGVPGAEPVLAGDYLASKLAAITGAAV
jgi:isopenicillin N synthase-like dioxygenase